MKAIDNSWFTCQTSFVANVIMPHISFPSHLHDSLTLRAILIFNKYGFISKPTACPVCKKTPKLHEVQTSGKSKFQWLCPTGGAKHMQEPMTGRFLFFVFIHTSR